MILNEETFAIEDSPPLELVVSVPNNENVGAQTVLMTQIQQLYTVVDSYNTSAVTFDDIGYEDMANVFRKYAQEILNQIGYLNILLQTVQPTVEVISNPITNNEITII